MATPQDPLKYSPPIAELTDEDVASIVHGDVSRILLKPGAPAPRVLGVRKWPRAIPQYNKGYAEIRKEVRWIANSICSLHVPRLGDFST